MKKKEKYNTAEMITCLDQSKHRDRLHHNQTYH